MDNSTPIYSLREVTEQFCIRRGNDRLKNFSRFFSIAGDVYSDIYKKILPSVVNKYLEVQTNSTDPYPFVYTPQNISRFFGIWITNHYGNLIQVFYNDKLNVLPKPKKVLPCGCLQTDLCECVNNLQVIITPKIIDGVTYYIKEWLECCGNGDVLKYSETPVIKYGNEGGSYSNDYSDDYDIINAGNNIVYIKQTKNLGKLETKNCGCPVESEANTDLIFNTCGCFLPQRRACCKRYYQNKLDCIGQINFSDCGDKIYLKDVKTDNGYVVACYQTNGIACGEEIFVPEYARKAIWAGIEYESTIYFPKSSATDKLLSKNNYRAEKAELFEYLNPLHEEYLFDSITAEIKF
jgi:hypothetical protein